MAWLTRGGVVSAPRHARVIYRTYAFPAHHVGRRQGASGVMPPKDDRARLRRSSWGNAMRFAALAASVAGLIVFGLSDRVPPTCSSRRSPLCAVLTAIGDLGPPANAPEHPPQLSDPGAYPVSLEKIRPEIRQYFLESDTDGTPFNRAKRAIAYQRAKGALDKRPFGTQHDVYGNNFEWINHSIDAASGDRPRLPRHRSAAPDCAQPYALSLFNISAMSFGALSRQRDPRAQPRRQARRLRPRHRRGRRQPLSPRERRRPDLGDRQRLFRLPQRRRQLLR